MVAIESGVLSIPDDFLTLEFREECERIIPDNDTIKPDEWKGAYVYLKQNFTLSVYYNNIGTCYPYGLFVNLCELSWNATTVTISMYITYHLLL